MCPHYLHFTVFFAAVACNEPPYIAEATTNDSMYTDGVATYGDNATYHCMEGHYFMSLQDTVASVTCLVSLGDETKGVWTTIPDTSCTSRLIWLEMLL